GNPAVVLGRLTELAGDRPFDESLVAVLMRALYGAGRPNEALDLYALTHRRMVEEIGTEPGPNLRAIQQAILRQELDPAPATSARPGPKSPVPAQLPADVPGFTGRRPELAWLHETAVGYSPALVISAVAGTAGVGKTALAVHWAHAVRNRFPDGQMHVNLRGY